MKAMKRILPVLAVSILLAFTAGAAKSNVVEKGKKVKFNYTLTVDGKVFDTNKGKPPLEFICGSNQIVSGLDKAMQGLKVGQKKTIVVSPEDGYGLVLPQAFAKIPKTAFPKDFQYQLGSAIDFHLPDGTSRTGVIRKIQDQHIIIDLNHPLAGKTLKFDVKIIDVQ